MYRKSAPGVPLPTQGIPCKARPAGPVYNVGTQPILTLNIFKFEMIRIKPDSMMS